MKSIACGVLLAAFLLMSTPTTPALSVAPAATVVCVIDMPASPRRRRRRNHYAGCNF